jgi:tRNA (guanine-N7-)-methyltransferase
MSRKLKFDIPGIDWRVRPDELREVGLEGLYAPELAPPLRLVVDVGFGRGEFLMELARENPTTAFLGIEYSFKRVLKMARRLARSDLVNVRLIEATAELVVGEQLPLASVDCFWINFPDPWPKKRHHRRRLIQPGFVRALARRLVAGGELHIATDHVGYAEWIEEVLAGEPGLENAFAPERFRQRVNDRPSTAYELEWRAKGHSFRFFSYRRRADVGCWGILNDPG